MSDRAQLIRDRARGILQRTDGDRVAVLPTEFLAALHRTIGSEFGDGAPDVLYRCGYEWALQEMVRLNAHLRENVADAPFDLWQTDAQHVLDSWWSAYAAGGWGRAVFDLSALARGVVFVELHGTGIGGAPTKAAKPMCHWYAGMFAGAVSFFQRAERHSTEMQCVAQGHPTCRFVVAPGAEIDSAETWRQQGTSAAEIIRRLR